MLLRNTNHILVLEFNLSNKEDNEKLILLALQPYKSR